MKVELIVESGRLDKGAFVTLHSFNKGMAIVHDSKGMFHDVYMTAIKVAEKVEG